MKLVMFLDACDHVNRICRVLRQPLGNALLLGVGGSGRQSLTKLATFMSSYKIYQIEVVKGYSMRDWRETPRRIWVIGLESSLDSDPLKLCLLGVEFRRKGSLLPQNSHLSLELEGHLEGPKLLLHRPSRELGVLRLANCLVANL